MLGGQKGGFVQPPQTPTPVYGPDTIPGSDIMTITVDDLQTSQTSKPGLDNIVCCYLLRRLPHYSGQYAPYAQFKEPVTPDTGTLNVQCSGVT